MPRSVFIGRCPSRLSSAGRQVGRAIDPAHGWLSELHPGLVEAPELPESSQQRVLHLHGSASVYASEFHIRRDHPERLAMIESRPEPLFVFDPDNLVEHFFPLVAPDPTPGYETPGGRIIAPVPDKAPTLSAPFVRATYGAAADVLAATPLLVAIGYSFNRNDASSYAPLLRTPRHPKCHRPGRGVSGGSVLVGYLVVWTRRRRTFVSR